ncbi:PH domain-containing protein [Streptomyces albidoflavus]|uniref:PH domain-containing protein n=1 Tax=Streptomyces albidoflavus TaxID=1886 RepID=UPI0033D97D10
MSTPQSSAPEPRTYRSTASLVAGALLLALGAWFGVDAIWRGSGRTPWLALAALVLLVPLVVAYTLRPAVVSDEDRLTVRNPFRTVTLPWAAVAELRSGFTNEVRSDGRTYQLWALPVSLRARKKAARAQMRDAVADPHGATPTTVAQPTRSDSDQAVEDLREIAERRAAAPGAQGPAVVRWAYEIIAPAAVGAVALVVLVATG